MEVIKVNIRIMLKLILTVEEEKNRTNLVQNKGHFWALENKLMKFQVP
jgi:hypothetical protein